jgi:hypothetical protein
MFSLAGVLSRGAARLVAVEAGVVHLVSTRDLSLAVTRPPSARASDKCRMGSSPAAWSLSGPFCSWFQGSAAMIWAPATCTRGWSAGV